jgi:hypothetical protein
MNGGGHCCSKRTFLLKKNWDSGVLGFVPWHLTCLSSSWVGFGSSHFVLAQVSSDFHSYGSSVTIPTSLLWFFFFFLFTIFGLAYQGKRILCLKIHYRV